MLAVSANLFASTFYGQVIDSHAKELPMGVLDGGTYNMVTRFFAILAANYQYLLALISDFQATICAAYHLGIPLAMICRHRKMKYFNYFVFHGVGDCGLFRRACRR